MPRKKPSRTPVAPSSTKSPKRRASRTSKSVKDPLAEFRLAMEAKPGEGDVAVRVEHLDGEVLSRVLWWLSTGVLDLDAILGWRGLPAGRVVEVFGPNHVGKSTLLDTFFAAVQRIGGHGILIDTEGARDLDYTRNLGVDVGKLQVIEFERNERTIENVVNRIFQTLDWWHDNYPEIKIVVGWDALGSTATQAEIEARVGDKHVAEAARVMRQACRQVAGKIGGTNMLLVVCNHQYANIGMMGRGPKRETYAGEALRHATSIRIEMFNAGTVKVGGEAIGKEVGLRLVKNRLGPPGECRLAFIPGLGVDNTWTLYQRLVGAEVIQSSGSWSVLNTGTEILKFQGWTGLRNKVAEIPDLFPRLVEAYRQVAPPPAGLLEEG